MARRASQYIELSGPLFSESVKLVFNDAVAEGIEELAEEGDDMMAQAIAAGGYVDTGRLLRSVDIDYQRNNRGVIGYAKILPTDVWGPGEPGRPTRVWVSRGMRKGVKLRPAYNIFARTATGLRNVNQQFIADKIASALNG